MIEVADSNAWIECADSMRGFNVRIQYAESLHSLNVIAAKIEMKLSRTLSVQY